MPCLSALWRKRYPQLVRILVDEPAAPKGNVVVRNVSYGGKWDEIEGAARPYVTFTDNLVDKDPLFEDVPPKGFRLRADSSAYALGFKPIPFEEIGLYQNMHRQDLPEK